MKYICVRTNTSTENRLFFNISYWILLLLSLFCLSLKLEVRVPLKDELHTKSTFVAVGEIYLDSRNFFGGDQPKCPDFYWFEALQIALTMFLDFTILIYNKKLIFIYNI